MQWTPTGISNSLAWLVRHCADLLWLSYGRLSGERVPVNLETSGIAWSSVKNTLFDETAPESGLDAQARICYLDRAWQTLKAYLQSYPEWPQIELTVERRRQSAWGFCPSLPGSASTRGRTTGPRKPTPGPTTGARGQDFAKLYARSIQPKGTDYGGASWVTSTLKMRPVS
jgi:hypothetical protein